MRGGAVDASGFSPEGDKGHCLVTADATGSVLRGDKRASARNCPARGKTHFSGIENAAFFLVLRRRCQHIRVLIAGHTQCHVLAGCRSQEFKMKIYLQLDKGP